MFELYVGVLVATILALGIKRLIWPSRRVLQRAAERFEARNAFVRRIPD